MSNNITVGTAPTRVASLDVQQAEVVTVHLKNNGAAALASFSLKGKGGQGADLGFVTLKSGGFTVADLHCIYASSEPGALASGGECLLYLTPGYLRNIELWASVASGTTDVAIELNRSEG